MTLRRRPDGVPWVGRSDQIVTPEMHQRLQEEFEAETRRLLAQPCIPNPRYEINHWPAFPDIRFPLFTIVYHADNPSAALQVAHRFAEKLGLRLKFYDRFTQDSRVIRAVEDDGGTADVR